MLRVNITSMRRRLRPVVVHYRVLMRLRAQLGTWRLVRMPWLFYKGFMRVFSTVDFGRFVPGVDKSAPKSPALSAVHDRESLLQVVQQSFVLKRVATYGHLESHVLFFGGTKNNEREFEFLSAKARHLGLAYSRDVNMSFLEKQRLDDTQDDLSCKLFLYRLIELFSRRLVCNPAVANLLLNYCKYFYLFFRYFKQAPERLPTLAVLANDHSSSAVAFSMVMKLFGVPRLYLQHAEVSPRFPALDFEYSILRNSHSAQLYRQIRSPRGRIYVVARHVQSANFERIFKSTEERVDIVIYLTAVFVPAQVREATALLRRNPGVASVKAKLHPRTTPELQASLGELQLVNEAPAGEHIAIVANSSMTIELLSAGTKVFQLFTLDEIGADYYGFVANGLTAEVASEDLQGTFWRRSFYTEAWRERMASYDPGLAHSPDDLERLLQDLAADLVAIQ